MRPCPLCGHAMIRASYYDPDGLIPLNGGLHDDVDWWVCIDRGCRDGAMNTRLAEMR